MVLNDRIAPLLSSRAAFVDPPYSHESVNPYPVQPFGFLLGVLVASLLFGIHVSQVERYFRLYRSDTRSTKLLVTWVFSLSTLQTLINWSAVIHYFVRGIDNPRLWGGFWWPLSVQDGLVPTMAMTAHFFFGNRVVSLLGYRRTVHAILFSVVPLNWLIGIAMAVLSYFWARHPFDKQYTLHTAAVRRTADVIPLVWLALSALIDGSLTLALTFHLLRLSSSFARTKRVISRLMRLTLETVGLTHLVGAIMAVLFIATRTRTDAFWFFLELVTELYALSILFTLNSRASMRQSLAGSPGDIDISVPEKPLGAARRSPPHRRDHHDEDDRRRQLQFFTVEDGPDGQLEARWRERSRVQQPLSLSQSNSLSRTRSRNATRHTTSTGFLGARNGSEGTGTSDETPASPATSDEVFKEEDEVDSPRTSEQSSGEVDSSKRTSTLDRGRGRSSDDDDDRAKDYVPTMSKHKSHQ